MGAADRHENRQALTGYELAVRCVDAERSGLGKLAKGDGYGWGRRAPGGLPPVSTPPQTARHQHQRKWRLHSPGAGDGAVGTDCLRPLTPLQGIRIPASPTALHSRPGPAGRHTLSSRARTSRLPSLLSSGPLALLRPHVLLTGQPGSPGPVPASTLWTVLAASTPYPPGSAALGPSQPPWASPVEGVKETRLHHPSSRSPGFKGPTVF